MPTKKREWYPYASFHATARGNHRNDIFKDKEDFIYYLTLIKEAVKYYIYDKYEIISYCLMDNHVHILIKTGERPLGQFIGKINSKYAKYYNKKYNILVKSKVISDGNVKVVASVDGSRVYYSKENQRTEIYIDIIN